MSESRLRHLLHGQLGHEFTAHQLDDVAREQIGDGGQSADAPAVSRGAL